MAKLTQKRIGGIRCNYTSASSISLVLSVFTALVCQICTGLEVVVVHGARYRQPVARVRKQIFGSISSKKSMMHDDDAYGATPRSREYKSPHDLSLAPEDSVTINHIPRSS